MSAKWFNIQNKAEQPAAEILIYDQIGKDWFTGDGIAAKDFAESLAEIPKDRNIVVGINSPGGNVWDGLAIYHQLKARGERVTTRIDGVAASIASVIALAGHKVEMPENALMMIHRAWGMAMGNAAELTKLAADLEKHDQVIAGVYSARNGKPVEENLRAMDAETWFTGAEAKAFGLVDSVSARVAMNNSFDLSKFNFKNLSAVADAHQVSNEPHGATHAQPQTNLPAVNPPPAATTTTHQKDTSMTEPTPTAAVTQPAAIDTKPIIDAITALGDRLAPAPAAAAPGAAPLNHNIDVVESGDQLWERAAKIQDLADRTRFVRKNITSNKSLTFKPINANTLGGTEITRIAQMSLDALLTQMAPLSAFTTDFSAEAAAPGKVITTRYITQPSTQDFSSSKAVGNNTTTAKSITLNQYKGVSLGFTDLERTYTDVQLAELFLKPSVTAIYEDVIASLLALVVSGTYSSSVTKTSAQLDADVVADLASTLSTNKAPTSQRSLILSPAYYANLVKDSSIQAAYAYGGAEAIRENNAGRVHGFDVISYNGTIPGNSENLTGLALHKSALLIASRRVVSPQSGTWYGQVASASDPESGLTLDLRQHYDGTSQVLQMSLLYGVAAGHGAALVRIKSA